MNQFFQSIARLIIGYSSNFSLCGLLRNWVRYFALESPSFISHVLATNYFAGSKPQAAVPAPAKPGDAPAVDPRMSPPANAHLGWALNQRVDMHVYLTTSPTGDVFSNQWTSGRRENHDKGLPNFVWENLTLGNWKDSRTVEMEIKFPEVSILLCVCSIIHYFFH
jgi:hypothetical protein